MEPVKEATVTSETCTALDKPSASRDGNAAHNKTIDEALAQIKKGSVLWKVRSFNGWYRRFYLLDDKDFVLRYEPSHKPGCYTYPQEIEVEDILDVRKGWKTDTFNKIGRKVEKNLAKCPESSPALREECCFSVVYGSAKQTLDLVAPDPASADAWVQGLLKIIDVLKKKNREDVFDRWLQEQFDDADDDKSGGLNFVECCKLLKQLNVKMEKHAAEKLFNDANTNHHFKNGEQVLDFCEFLTFFCNLMSRPDIMAIYEKYALMHNKKEMDAQGLYKFLTEEQQISNISINDCVRDIEVYEQSQLRKSCKLSPLGFINMMMSEKYEILNPGHRLIYQDMNQPLSHYYMASSHNTYLIGGQLKGDSSVEGYIDALRRGCRCVELDCWDGPDNEPIIYHGYTLTTKILFRDVITDAIKPFAFKTSVYPVVLSLENHCSEKQQQVMAKYMREILLNDDKTSMLYSEDPVEDMDHLPSPEELKYKIIIKAKKAKTVMADKPSDPESSSEEDTTDSSAEKVVSQELSNLVNLCQAVHFHGFEHTQKKGKCFEISSFSEAKAEKLIESEGKEFVDYNRRQLSRIYPSATRTTSSNFKPTPFWNVGCQMVALNYQSSQRPVFLNESKFRQNGCCGYLLKPSFLREHVDYHPKTGLENCAKLLKLRIISGQYIPKSDPEDVQDVVDPYVKVKIIGHPLDEQALKTKVVKDNGFNPRWNHEMSFVVNMPELAMVCIVVKDESTSGASGTLGIYALPFTSLSEGYRHIFLMDYSRKPIPPASLFVHISITHHAPPPVKVTTPVLNGS